ncbi:MAG: hypothetical protein KC646_09700 [Candidatus Cloacimonetes bacterium]|nr:hypothetical protein [Candidatus Cloacimonadota bacterium]
MLFLRFSIIICLILSLSGCGGGGGGGDFTAPSGTATPVLSNSSVEGKDYNLVSVQYSPIRSAAGDQFDYNLIHFNASEIRNNPSIFEHDQDIKISGYNLNTLSQGMGTIEVAVPNQIVKRTVPLAVTPDGTLGLFSLNSTQNTSPSLGMFVKSSERQELSTSLFTGRWGFATLTARGNGVIAQLDLNHDTTKDVGMVSNGFGFATTTAGLVSTVPVRVQTGLLSLNVTKDRLQFLGSDWHVGINESVAISPSGTSVNNDRLSIMMKTSASTTFTATYNLFQWTTFSPTSANSTVYRTSIATSEVIQLGKLVFNGNSVFLDNVVGLASRSTSFARVEGGIATTSGHMFRLDSSFEGNNIDFKMRFFMSADEEFLLGLDYDNDSNATGGDGARATMFLGIKQN